MKLMRSMVPVIIWIIVISFALWGVENVFLSLQKESKGVGKAFGKTVSFKTFQDAFKTAQLFSQKPSDEKQSIEELETTAWQNIVLEMEAKRERIAISDAEVRAEIERLFTTDGSVFNPQFYQAWVSNTFKESPRLFEERIRKTLMIRELIHRHQNTEISVGDQEVTEALENQNTKATIEYHRYNDLATAQKNYIEISQPENWEKQKSEKETPVQSIGPLGLDIIAAMLGLKEEDVNSIKTLEINGFSKPMATNDGVSIIRLTHKEVGNIPEMNEAAVNDFKEKLVERKRQEIFLDWWQNLMREANIQKFAKTEPAAE